MGSVESNRRGDGDVQTLALPFVYALLSSKEALQYTLVLNAVKSKAKEWKIRAFEPDRIMLDFEQAIIKACQDVYPNGMLAACFFHLAQSVYRKVQEVGLQKAYNDKIDREVRNQVHMLTALAFVPVDEVGKSFSLFKDQAPDVLEPVIDYFRDNYISGAVGRGRPRRDARFPIELWNQYDATLKGIHITNNVSEGWHNQFRVLVGKNHPDLYAAINEFRKEQGLTEISIAEIGLGKLIRGAPLRKWKLAHERKRVIVERFEKYKNQKKILDYLQNLAHNVTISYRCEASIC